MLHGGWRPIAVRLLFFSPFPSTSLCVFAGDLHSANQRSVPKHAGLMLSTYKYRLLHAVLCGIIHTVFVAFSVEYMWCMRVGAGARLRFSVLKLI